MSYEFDPTGSDPLDALVDRVISNTFSATKFDALVRTWLNDAVTDVCRKLEMQRTYAILDYDADGVVTQPASPFFAIESIYLADADATGGGEQAFSRYARCRLTPAGRGDLPLLGVGTGEPIFYSARRAGYATRSPALKLVVVPATAAGKIAVAGLTRPPVMDDGGDVSGLGAEYDRALVAYARAQAFEREDDMDMSDRWLQRYDLALRDAIHGPDQNDEPEVVEGAWGDGDC